MTPDPVDIERLPALAAWAEAQYNLKARHPEREAIYADYTSRSQRFRDAARWETLRYAEPNRCTIDWFPASNTAGEATPLLVFIHGGFWRGGDKRVFSFLAEPYVASGVSVALLGYELAPQVSVTRIAEQITHAVAWLVQRASRLGFDPDRVTLSGHSAGGHLSALLSTMSPSIFGDHRFRGILPISGIFRLAPMLLTSINHESRITALEAVALSPGLKDKFLSRRYMVVVGGGETEDFISQTRQFGSAVVNACPGSTVEVVPGRHHFDIFDDLANPTTPLFKRARRLIVGTED
jgi:arylformamidase